MELLERLELFSRTVENRFVFGLFDLLLCGVIALVILRGWRAHTKLLSTKNQLFLFLGFSSLGASFALTAIFAGTFLFVERRLPEAPFDLLSHIFEGSAWLLLAASTHYQATDAQTGPARSPSQSAVPLLLGFPLLYLAEWMAQLQPKLDIVLDLVNLVLVAFILVLFYRRPLGGRKITTAAPALLCVAALMHVSSALVFEERLSVVFWNLEQFAWSLSLFSFALAIGETRSDLFDRIFVRLQVAFILLASLMILIITQTERTEYLTSIRSRSDQLAEFIRAQADYFLRQNEPLSALLEKEDFLHSITVGLGNLPELKIIRILADSDVATFEIADNGEIHRGMQTLPSAHPLSSLDADEYFPTHILPLTARSGEVELYGARRFLYQHIRKRIIVIFSLFTGMVALSTLMIGLVVRGASVTIKQQAREIEEGQRRLIQASRLASIGELAAGVAHEVNNPVTTILSRASYLLSEEKPDVLAGYREDLSTIVTQAQRITKITRGLLTFSHTHVLDMKAVPIGPVIETAISAVDGLLASRQVAVEKSLQTDLPRVLADKDGLARALENLFYNAIDAMPDGGLLQIRAVKEDVSRVRLEVSDTGIGIPSNNLTRIFDPFFTTKEVGKGTGMGLSIVHGIIREHNGNITVTSKPGMGTKFVITLPAER
ncbi:MAG: hypothetical protein HY644_10375 [Acidobacteria bacterium]|nr:hypothetical protein [Acidobacteriota bacterium]